MSRISEFSNFQDGVAAGERLLALFERLGLNFQSLEPPSEKSLNEVLHFMWERSLIQRPYPAVAGFISTILRKDSYDAGIMEVWGADSLIEGQTETAPTCEIPPEAGLIQFGTWSDQSDGDSWCFDLKKDYIRCIPVAVGDNDINRVLTYSYGVVPSCHHFVAYLECDVEIAELDT